MASPFRVSSLAPRDLCVALVLSVSGCTLTNPHIVVPRPEAREYSIVVTDPATGKKTTFSEAAGVSLDDGIAYANLHKDAYKGAIGDQTVLNNRLATGLIPLGAATLGAAIGGASAETIGYLALAGASVYTLGQWYSRPERKAVWVAGMNGMTCAVEAVLPLRINRQALAHDLDLLRRNAAVASAKTREASRLVTEIQGLAGGPVVSTTAAAASLATASEVLGRARQVYGDGFSLYVLSGRMGDVLVQHVDRIDTLVNKQLNNTVPDVETLPNLISGLGQTARTLTGLTGGAAALFDKADILLAPTDVGVARADNQQRLLAIDTRQVQLEQQLTKVLADLDEALGTIKWASVSIEAKVNNATRSKPSETLQACGIKEVESVSFAMSVSPPGEIQVAKGKSRVLLVKGGIRPYRARLDRLSAPGVTVSQDFDSGRTITIVADANAEDDTYTLFVVDAASGAAQQIISIKLTVGTPTLQSLTGATLSVVPAQPLTKAEQFVSKLKVSPCEDWDFNLEGGTFQLVAPVVSGAQRDMVTVTLGTDGKHTKEVSEDTLRTKIAALGRDRSVSKDKISISNYTSVKSPGAFAPLVCKLQARLAPCMPVGGKTDGFWGKKSQAALQKYLQAVGKNAVNEATISIQRDLLSRTQEKMEQLCQASTTASTTPPRADGGSEGLSAAVLKDFAERLKGQSIMIDTETLTVERVPIVDAANQTVAVVLGVRQGFKRDEAQVKAKLLEVGAGAADGISVDNIRPSFSAL